MSLADLHSLATLAAFIAFIAIGWWAYSPKNKQRFEEDANLALDDEQLSSSDADAKRTKD